MKGIQGLIIAVGLGIVAAMFNWAYLREKSKNTEMVYFVGVAKNQTVAWGEKFTREKLDRVGIPKINAKNLENFAILWKAWDTVVDQRSSRLIPSGDLVLRQDLEMPPSALAEPEADRIWVTLATGAIMTPQISPGDTISFIVSAPRQAPPRGGLPGESEPAADSSQPAAASGRTRTIGPFLVLSLGDRVGSPETARKGNRSRASENVIGIKVTLDSAGSLNPEAQALLDALQATNSRPLGVVLHGKKQKHANL